MADAAPDQNDGEFLAKLPSWNRFFDGYQPPPVLADEYPLRELRLRCVNLRRRLRDGPLAPLRLAFFGPTGAGKSKLFSSLICRIVSASGFRRPFTMKSCYFVHNDWKPLVAALEGVVEMHSEPEWQEIILVDTPDFDSVELANRDEAERVFLEADAFLFVTDALKYADASTWDYLASIRRAGKKFAVLLNKVGSDAIPESFDARYRDTFSIESGESLPYEKILIPELPLRDDELIGTDHPSHKALRDIAMHLAGKEPSKHSVARYRGELEGIFGRSTELLTELRERRSQLSDLRKRLDQRFEDAAVRLKARMSETVPPEAKEQVYQGMMKKFDEIDILRHPRRIIAMPIKGAYSLIRKYGGWGDPDDKADEAPKTTDPLATETFHLVESELIRFADETRLDLIDQPGLKRLVDRDRFKQLRLDHAEVKQLFVEHDDSFRSWVGSHATETAEDITTEHKAKFYVSQLLYNGVVISAQAATLGQLSWVELGLDSVISPFVAKGIGMVIGNEKVREFEEAARAEHHRSLADILARGKERFVEFVDQATEGLDKLETQLAEIAACEPRLEKLIADFESGAAAGAGEGSHD